MLEDEINHQLKSKKKVHIESAVKVPSTKDSYGNAWQEPFEQLDTKNNLQYTLKPFLIFAQIFGILPLYGLCCNKKDTWCRNIRFSWFSPCLLITFVLLLLAVSEVALSFQAVAEQGLKLRTTGSLTFSIVVLLAYVLFLVFAYNWQQTMSETRACEEIFLQKRYASAEAQYFKRSIRVLCTCLLIGALTEHLAFKAQAIYTTYDAIMQRNGTDLAINYYSREGTRLLRGLRYCKWMVPIIEWPQIAFTFAWNFVDIYVAVMGKCFTLRFQQMRWCIARHINKNMPVDFWRQVREDFLMLLDLLASYDSKLSGLMLLSCTHNLYFICVQIFHSFKPKTHIVVEIYFWYSLTFVIIRVFTMMFNAAAVHDEAKRIMSLTYEIPSSQWCIELKRLNEVLVTDVIALSGHKFFFLTRSLIMAMVGKIIVYELVLLDKVEDPDA